MKWDSKISQNIGKLHRDVFFYLTAREVRSDQIYLCDNTIKVTTALFILQKKNNIVVCFLSHNMHEIYIYCFRKEVEAYGSIKTKHIIN